MDRPKFYGDRDILWRLWGCRMCALPESAHDEGLIDLIVVRTGVHLDKLRWLDVDVRR